MPEPIRLMEVGPRDGLQSVKERVPTDAKVAFVDALSRSGLRDIEVSSFVSPRWVPQLADAEEVVIAEHATNAVSACAMLAVRRFDALLIDRPNFSEICRVLPDPAERAQQLPPVVVLSRRDDPEEALEVLRQETSLEPAVCLGHSLGEFSALVAVEALTFEDAVRVVRLRGEAMQQAVPAGSGAMAAVMGLESDVVDEPVEMAQAAEADAAAADDFEWDAEESEALKQARKDAELTASADSVRAYLKQIGKVPLLNAEQEVELAKRIEAGLYAAERLRQAEEEGLQLTRDMQRDLLWVSRDGERLLLERTRW